MFHKFSFQVFLIYGCKWKNNKIDDELLPVNQEWDMKTHARLKDYYMSVNDKDIILGIVNLIDNKNSYNIRFQVMSRPNKR